MTRLTLLAVATALLLGANGATATDPKLERRLDDASRVLEQFTAIPEQGIPPRLLNNAYAVAVLPNTIKAGFILGGRFGQGVLVVRRPDGSWSNPAFINLGGGSVGFQAGAQSSDVVLVFKTKRSVDKIYKGKLTLGGDTALAAGPWGRQASAATDLSLKAEIFSYARNRGLFGGIALDGSVLAMNNKANVAYYQYTQGTARDILSDQTIPTPARAREFQDVLAAAAPALNWQSGTQHARAVTSPVRAEEPALTTYGIDEAPAADVVF